MRRLVSTHLFRRQRLRAAHLDLLQSAGVEGIELFCARSSFDYRDPGQRADIAAWFSANAVKLHSIHSPIYADEQDGRTGEPPIDIADPDTRRRVTALDEVERALEIADHVPFRYLVQHVGPPRVEFSQRKADWALSSLERIRLLAKQAGISVLVENIPNGLSQPEPLLDFLNRNHLDDIGICFDAGHAHLPNEMFGGGGVAASWAILGGRVRSTHLHDNRGSSDDHLWPGDGNVEWTRLAALLTAGGPDLPWLLEVGDHGEVPELAPRIRRSFEVLAAGGE